MDVSGDEHLKALVLLY